MQLTMFMAAIMTNLSDPSEEHVVQDQQVWLQQVLQAFALFFWACQTELRKRAVGLHVAYVVALQRGLVCQRLGEVAFAGAGGIISLMPGNLSEAAPALGFS